MKEAWTGLYTKKKKTTTTGTLLNVKHTDLNTQSNAMREVVSFHHFEVVGIEAMRS